MKRNQYLRTFSVLAVSLIILQSCSNDADSNYGNDDPISNTSEQTAPSTSQPEEVSTTSLEFDITNSGARSYIFNSDDLTDEEDPNITLKRGVTYTFNIDSPGHPFYITTVQNTSISNAYNDGVTNNGTESGTIVFQVPSDAPDTLYYICEFHSSMTGTFAIED